MALYELRLTLAAKHVGQLLEVTRSVLVEGVLLLCVCAAARDCGLLVHVGRPWFWGDSARHTVYVPMMSQTPFGSRVVIHEVAFVAQRGCCDASPQLG